MSTEGAGALCGTVRAVVPGASELAPLRACWLCVYVGWGGGGGYALYEHTGGTCISCQLCVCVCV